MTIEIEEIRNGFICTVKYTESNKERLCFTNIDKVNEYLRKRYAPNIKDCQTIKL